MALDPIFPDSWRLPPRSGQERRLLGGFAAAVGAVRRRVVPELFDFVCWSSGGRDGEPVGGFVLLGVELGAFPAVVVDRSAEEEE